MQAAQPRYFNSFKTFTTIETITNAQSAKEPGLKRKAALIFINLCCADHQRCNGTSV
jgi:hypothetical protein